MEPFAQLKKRFWFWVLAGYLLVFTVAYLAILATHNVWFVGWKRLPPLPNGETGRRFTEILVRDSIDLLTDQGNYYRCRFRVPDNCWISIPKEKLQQANYNEERPARVPEPPPGARQVAVLYHSHDHRDEVFMVVIRRDGQVQVWDHDVEYFSRTMDSLVGIVCAGYFAFIGMGVGVMVDLFVNKRWQERKDE